MAFGSESSKVIRAAMCVPYRGARGNVYGRFVARFVPVAWLREYLPSRLEWSLFYTTVERALE